MEGERNGRGSLTFLSSHTTSSFTLFPSLASLSYSPLHPNPSQSCYSISRPSLSQTQPFLHILPVQTPLNHTNPSKPFPVPPHPRANHIYVPHTTSSMALGCNWARDLPCVRGRRAAPVTNLLNDVGSVITRSQRHLLS